MYGRLILGSWAVLALHAGVAWASDDVSVALYKITEVRETKLIKDDGESMTFSFSGAKPGLTLTLELSGTVAASASHYGHIKLDSAKDDQGTAVELRTGGFSMNDPVKEFVRIDRSQMFFGRDEEARKDRLEIEIPLELPARKAERLAVVEGTLKLRGGETKDVLLANVRGKPGTVLENKLLEESGLKVRIAKAGDGMQPDDPAKAVSIDVKGKLGALLKVELVRRGGRCAQRVIDVVRQRRTPHVYAGSR